MCYVLCALYVADCVVVCVICGICGVNVCWCECVLVCCVCCLCCVCAFEMLRCECTLSIEFLLFFLFPFFMRSFSPFFLSFFSFPFIGSNSKNRFGIVIHIQSLDHTNSLTPMQHTHYTTHQHTRKHTPAHIHTSTHSHQHTNAQHTQTQHTQHTQTATYNAHNT